MLKINLLPKSIDIARQRNIAIGVVTALIAAEIGVLLYMRTGPEAERARLTARKQEAEGQLSQLNAIKTQADAVLAQEAGLAPKYDFITKTIEYNRAYPQLYRRVTGYTYAEVMFLNLQASNNQLTFDAYVSNPTDVSRLMLGLSRSPIIQGLPVITGVPGWDAEEQAQRRREEARQNREEALPGAGSGIIGGIGAPGAEGAPGGGMPPGFGGGAYPGMGGAEGGKNLPGAASMGGMPGGYPGGGGMPGGYPGGGGMPGGGGAYPGAGGGQGGGGDMSRLRLDSARLKPRGFTVNVTVPLRQPIPGRPSYDNSDQQAGTAGGGGGGFGGFGGGYPGMGGGMGSGGFGGGYPGGGGGYPGG